MKETGNREESTLSAALEQKLKARRREKRKKRRMTTGIMIAATAAVVVLGICLTALIRNVVEDRNAKTLSEDTITKEDLRLQLQQQTDESNFRLLINTAPVSKDGQTADWCISNSASNHYNMQVVICREDGTELYTSAVLAPGRDELEGKMTQTQEAGTYPATATAYALDPENGEKIGEAVVDIILTVGPEAADDAGAITDSSSEESL